MGPRLDRKAVTASRAREAPGKHGESIRNKSGLESGGMPEKLKDCNEKGSRPLDENLYCEGDSAAGKRQPGP